VAHFSKLLTFYLAVIDLLHQRPTVPVSPEDDVDDARTLTNRIPFASAAGMPPVFSARSGPDGYQVDGPSEHRAGSAGAGDVFAQWRWDGQQLVVENDQWGVQPMFWAAAQNGVHVSTSIDALLDAGVPPTLDDSAMAVFLRTGYFIGDDTPFARIRALSPAARLTWSREGIKVASHWIPPAAQPVARADAAAEFSRLLTASVNRCSAGSAPTVVLLSGGHASRHILFALQALDRPPKRCVTIQPYSSASADDVKLAAMLADAVGVKHLVLLQHSDRVGMQVLTQSLTHSCADEHAHFLPLRWYLQHLRFHAFDGLGGGLLSHSRYLDGVRNRLFAEARVSDIANDVLGDPDGIEPALGSLIGPDGLKRFERCKAVARVASEAALHISAPNPVASFAFSTRIRRQGALSPYGVLEGCPISTPFLDSALVDFLLSLPFDAVADGRLHTDTLRQHYPRYAHIPFAQQHRRADHRHVVRRDAVALLRVVSDTRSTLVHRSAVAARTLKAVASGSTSHLWFLPRIVHLLEVERRTRGEAVSAPAQTDPAAGTRAA